MMQNPTAKPENWEAFGQAGAKSDQPQKWPDTGMALLLMEEIRRSPVEVGSLSHYLQGPLNIPAVAGFLNHQPYLSETLGTPFLEITDN